MAYWLLKTEPTSYSWDDLLRDGRTAWTGVTSPLAQRNLRTMRQGDRVVIYHSGEKRAVGVAEVVRTAYPDPTGDGARVCVDLRPVSPLPTAVTLDQLKLEPTFEGSVLLRQGRLSVVPLAPAEWRDLQSLSELLSRTGGLDAGPRF